MDRRELINQQGALKKGRWNEDEEVEHGSDLDKTKEDNQGHAKRAKLINRSADVRRPCKRQYLCLQFWVARSWNILGYFTYLTLLRHSSFLNPSFFHMLFSFLLRNLTIKSTFRDAVNITAIHEFIYFSWITCISSIKTHFLAIYVVILLEGCRSCDRGINIRISC